MTQSPSVRTSPPYAGVLIWISTGRFRRWKMAPVKNVFRPHCTFQYWVSRLALIAMLALVVMPTAGRLHAAAAGVRTIGATGGTHYSAANEAGEHSDHRAAATQPHAPYAPVEPNPGHAGHDDCAYCPLLAQLAGAAPTTPLLAEPPAGPAPSLTAAIGHAARHPHGLHARGPPTPA